jgi:hypothetical protein
VPILDATPDSLETLLRDVCRNPVSYRETSERGPGYASKYHSGLRSAETLNSFLETVS